MPTGKALTVSTTLTPAQLLVVHKEFPEPEWRISEAIRCMIKDYFEARGVDFPPDANSFGGWKNHPNRKKG